MIAPQSRKNSKPVLFLASSATEDAEQNHLLLCASWLWQSNCSRRDRAKEGEGEMEETTEKNRKIAGNLLGGKER